VELSSKQRELVEAKIPLDDFAKVMDLADDYDFERTEDPAADFKSAVLMLNEEAALPSWLSEWCLVYGVDHNEMDLEPMDDEMDL
jgi:hypothetical protein